LLRDGWGRKINYLRISVTDRCNLQCMYCMPHTKIEASKRAELLTFEEIQRIARAASNLGVTDIRLTGGEPLLRREIDVLISLLKEIPGTNLSMTTNGILLPSLAGKLRLAGLERVNISIDTLNSKKYSYITRGGKLNQALSGIEAAFSHDLKPVKLNVVLIKGFNDDEINDFVALTLERELHVRFIELMPTCTIYERYRVAGAHIKRKIERTFGQLNKVNNLTGSGPSQNFIVNGAKGTLGFIEPHRPDFCSKCNRLRLAADGSLHPCLYSSDSLNVKGAAEKGHTKLLKKMLIEAANLKGMRVQSRTGETVSGMYRIGG